MTLLDKVIPQTQIKLLSIVYKYSNDKQRTKLFIKLTKCRNDL